MSLKEKLFKVSEGFPEKFKEVEKNVLALEAKIAERKVFLSKKSLMYEAMVKINDEDKTVKFFEMLKETGMGITSGEPTDISPGFGFKIEKYKIKGKEREGSIEEASKLFSKDYKYLFNYSIVRKKVEEEARNAGYSFIVTLSKRMF
ncbi:MAG: ribonucleoside-triphosphate reductase [Candidatus Bathyarchaeia archaeon]|nr:ribonucleoside-triphosphate reductase [Candidatus Bathyarchaeota archaeon]